MINKAQQLRIATAMTGVPVPPKGAAMVRRDDQPQRVDRAPHPDDRASKRAEKARRASVSVHTVSGGAGHSPAPAGKDSLRAEIRSAMERR